MSSESGEALLKAILSTVLQFSQPCLQIRHVHFRFQVAPPTRPGALEALRELWTGLLYRHPREDGGVVGSDDLICFTGEVCVLVPR